MVDDATRTTAITAVYGAIRADNTSLLNVSLALMGAGLAYLGATLAFAGQLGNVLHWLALAVLPMPLWIMVAFHSLLTSLAMTNAVTAKYLEEELLQLSGISADHCRLLGYKRGDKIMDSSISAVPHRVMNYLIYGGFGLLAVAYTIYVLWHVAREHAVGSMAFDAFYFLVAVMVILSWRAGSKHRDKLSVILPEYVREGMKDEEPDLVARRAARGDR